MSTEQTRQTTLEGITTWAIDPAHTQVAFTVKHLMITKVRGRFTDVSGQVTLDANEPERSAVEVEIDAASIDTRQEDRDQHLRSEDFLKTQEHPRLTFRSTRVDGFRLEPGTSFEVAGELTIRGVTKEVVLEAEFGGLGSDPWGGERVAFSASAKIDRRDFGLQWNQTLEKGGVLVGNEVRIDLEAQAVLQEESQQDAA